ncbi:MAG: prokaryotic E2 ligase family D protein [Chloroflexota bacterium]|nr:prokaryotic E2 ligase family D protein [Chloroflexota bacterium]
MADLASDPTLIHALLGHGPRSLGGLEAELLMYSGQYLLHYRDPRGHERYQLMTPDAVQVALSGMNSDSGWLPPGVVRCGHTPQGPFALYWQPPARHSIAVLLDGDPAPALLTVPLPGLVLAGLGTDYWIWALPQPDFDPQAPLSHMPLPNIYSDGRICWGNNPLPPASAAAMPQVWQLFLQAPFNNHIVAGRTRTADLDIRRLLQQLHQSAANAFPTAELLPLNYGGTTAGQLQRILTL